MIFDLHSLLPWTAVLAFAQFGGGNRGSPSFVEFAGSDTEPASLAESAGGNAEMASFAESVGSSAEVLSFVRSTGGNVGVFSFAAAKRALETVYRDHKVTLYCGCSYEDRNTIDHSSCGYEPKEGGLRAFRIEWEHVVPAQAFGQSFAAWRDGHPRCVDSRGHAYAGRRCASKVEPLYRQMEADMYNLYPEIGELNERRSNYSMAELAGEPREFGACDFEVRDHKVEPRPEIRGDIARAYQYMDAAYPGRGIIGRKNRKLFEAWASEDPVDAWECERALRIAAIQLNVNAVTDSACRALGL